MTRRKEQRQREIELLENIHFMLDQMLTESRINSQYPRQVVIVEGRLRR